MYLIICFRISIIVRYGDVFTKLIYSYIQGLPKGDCLKTDISLPEIAQCVSSLVISEVGCYYYVVREGSICNSTYSLRKRTQQLDTLRKILDYCMIKQIDSAIYIHYYFSYSYLIVKAVAQNNYQVLSAIYTRLEEQIYFIKKSITYGFF